MEIVTRGDGDRREGDFDDAGAPLGGAGGHSEGDRTGGGGEVGEDGFGAPGEGEGAVGVMERRKAGVLGFEPRQADSETAVLPLHHTPKSDVP